MSKAQAMSETMAAHLASHAAATRELGAQTRKIAESARELTHDIGVRLDFPELLQAIRDTQAAHRDMLVALAGIEKAIT